MSRVEREKHTDLQVRREMQTTDRTESAKTAGMIPYAPRYDLFVVERRFSYSISSKFKAKPGRVCHATDYRRDRVSS